MPGVCCRSPGNCSCRRSRRSRCREPQRGSCPQRTPSQCGIWWACLGSECSHSLSSWLGYFHSQKCRHSGRRWNGVWSEAAAWWIAVSAPRRTLPWRHPCRRISSCGGGQRRMARLLHPVEGLPCWAEAGESRWHFGDPAL